MKVSTSSSRRHCFWQRRALLFGTAVALAAVAVPAAAQASSMGAVNAAAQAPSRPQAASSFCAKVSPASISAIVGYSVPAGTPFTQHLKPTKANYGISAVVSSCTYGALTSLAGLAKDVILSFEVTSRPLTGTELKNAIGRAQKLKIKMTPYSGLGMTAFYYTFAESGINAQGMAAINGTEVYGAGVYTKVPAQSKLASLVRLAKKL